MLGLYENFPQTIHCTEIFNVLLSKRKLQQRFVQVFQEVNLNAFTFEQVGSPSVPNCTVIFEFGIADSEGFRYLDEEESSKLQNMLSAQTLRVMDWFCALRYYKNFEEKKKPLKFDYYMLRMNFEEKGFVEILVFHERGPRYISPADLVNFIDLKINQSVKRKILKRLDKS